MGSSLTLTVPQFPWGGLKALLLPLASVFLCPSAMKSRRGALRTSATAPGAVMTTGALGVTTQEVEESNTHPDSPGILRLQQAGDPQESKGQPRRIKKTFRFLAIH